MVFDEISDFKVSNNLDLLSVYVYIGLEIGENRIDCIFVGKSSHSGISSHMTRIFVIYASHEDDDVT